MSALPPDPVAIATELLASSRMRRAAVALSVEQIISMAARIWELDQVAAATGRYLAAQSHDRLSAFVASAPVLDAHDTLAEALEELGYITLRQHLNTEEETDGNAD